MKLKWSLESFSEAVLRKVGRKDKGSILEFAGSWKGDDIEAVFSEVMRDRESATVKKADI